MKPQCGDNCKGECSGEVNGIPHCPLKEPQPSKIWYDKYECFGDKYGELEYCRHCKDWWQCRYDYFDERF